MLKIFGIFFIMTEKAPFKLNNMYNVAIKSMLIYFQFFLKKFKFVFLSPARFKCMSWYIRFFGRKSIIIFLYFYTFYIPKRSEHPG